MTTNLVLLRSIPKRRKVHLRGGKLTGVKARKLISKIRSLSRTQKPIGLWIDSDGGSGKWAVELHEAIRSCGVPVYAYVTRANSAALVVLQACSLRVGKKHSKYNVHMPSFSHFFTVYPHMDIEKWIENAREVLETLEPALREEPTVKKVFSILYQRARRKGKSKEELIELMLANRTLSAEEALEWGFIDEIMGIRFPRG